MSPLLFGVALGLLFGSLVTNGVVLYLWQDRGKVWRERARQAEDAKKATEIRSAQQLDALLDRVRTERLELQPASVSVAVDPNARRYISDSTVDDDAWNNFRKVPDEELDD